jgi:hypothetical protein
MEMQTKPTATRRKSGTLGLIFYIGLAATGIALVMFGRDLELRANSEFREVHNLLLSGDILADGFDYINSVEPMPNSRIVGVDSYRYWQIQHIDGGLRGYFSFRVSGWRRLSDDFQSHEMVTVHFERSIGSRLRVVKLEPESVWKKGKTSERR